MKFNLLGTTLLVCISFASQANAEDSKLINNCIACHRTDGKSNQEGVPKLNGRPYSELVDVMKRLRDTRLPQPIILHTMSDAEIEEVATYFSSVK